ncbi:MAG: response regulator, partial [Chromatiales bacterium]|nr:response regulator [Chromatiales bacterium]
MRTAKETILIVDDVPENLMLLENILQDEYDVKLASSGVDALSIANNQPRPNMILLDVMMPEMDGYQVCKALKGNPSTAAIPVIFVTGLGDVEDEMLGFELG